ncbi:hypothetical protein EJB05_43595, partial [Eragrostis curvula]
MAWAPPALALPGVRVAAAPAPGAPARPLPVRPAGARLLFAARTHSSVTPPSHLRPRVANYGAPRAVQRCAPNPGDVHGPAVDALRGAAVDAFRPLMDNFGHVLSLDKVVDINDYNIGMPFGVAMASVGCFQLFKTNPWAFLDVVLGYAFYKLSVLSSQVHRQGFVNDFITKIKVAIIAIILIKELPSSNPDSLVWIFIRIHVYHLYLTTFYFAMKGWKQDARYALLETLESLQCNLGRILFGPDN